MITSLGNRTVKEIAALSQKGKERNQKDVFVAEGIKMFLEAPTERICGVYVSQSAESEVLLQCTEKLRGLSYELVSDEVFAKISDTMTPQGILCLVRQFHYDLKGILEDKGNGKIEKQMLLIMLEDIQDPGNLGTIFRTAEAVGADGVIMSRRTVDLYNPKTVRSTMGSVYRVPFLYVEDISSIIKLLQEKGVCVYAAHLGGKEYYEEFDYRKSTAFLIGNEGKGLRKETAACADMFVKIPMEGKVESLNAAVASSVLLYEAYRQRRM
ncbi:MAG: 23S rRNA (guanosine(2251)-2'-O)-methyltransferase RlmB [Lachnospiraceae bacterium]|nr:23S rRNA (guanosine(2251)-2'-O)-methyltransferase RlmB [Lachnospiraceae bacterium]